MSGKTIGEDCGCGAPHSRKTVAACKCGCGKCFCRHCYGLHCIEIVESLTAPRDPGDDEIPFVTDGDPTGWRVGASPIGDTTTTPPSWRVFVGAVRGPQGDPGVLHPGPGIAMTPAVAGRLGRQLVNLEQACQQPPTIPALKS